MGTPAVLIRKSTGEIIKRADYPREDMQAIEGLDPDLEWLVIHEPFIAPDYDSRIFVLQQTESITTQPHPEWSWLNQFQVTYSTVKRDVPEIQTSIENAEREANEALLPYNQQLKLLTLGVATLFRKTSGMTLNAKEQAIADKVVAVATNIWKNDAALKAKLAELTAGTEPNIDAGWVKS